MTFFFLLLKLFKIFKYEIYNLIIICSMHEKIGYKGQTRSTLLQTPGFLSGNSKLSRCCQSCEFFIIIFKKIFWLCVGGIKTELGEDNCLIRKCPLCGQLIKDADFENLNDEEFGDKNTMENYQNSIEIYQLIGKSGTLYYKHAAFCLMTQKYPDSVHRVGIQERNQR